MAAFSRKPQGEKIGMDRTSQLHAASSATDRIRELSGRRRSYSRRQEEILDDLEEVFLSNGFRASTVDDLAAAAQCSRKTLYDLAPSKAQLFALVLDRMWRRLGDQVRESMAQESTAQAQIAVYVRDGLSIFKFPWGAVFEDIESYPPARRLHHDHIDAGIDLLCELITAGMEAGEFTRTNPRLVAETIAASVIHLSQQSVLRQIGGTAEEAADELTRMVFAGLSPRGPEGRAPKAGVVR